MKFCSNDLCFNSLTSSSTSSEKKESTSSSSSLSVAPPFILLTLRCNSSRFRTISWNASLVSFFSFFPYRINVRANLLVVACLYLARSYARSSSCFSQYRWAVSGSIDSSLFNRVFSVFYLSRFLILWYNLLFILAARLRFASSLKSKCFILANSPTLRSISSAVRVRPNSSSSNSFLLFSFYKLDFAKFYAISELILPTLSSLFSDVKNPLRPIFPALPSAPKSVCSYFARCFNYGSHSFAFSSATFVLARRVMRYISTDDIGSPSICVFLSLTNSLIDAFTALALTPFELDSKGFSKSLSSSFELAWYYFACLWTDLFFSFAEED